MWLVCNQVGVATEIFASENNKFEQKEFDSGNIYISSVIGNYSF